MSVRVALVAALVALVALLSGCQAPDPHQAQTSSEDVSAPRVGVRAPITPGIPVVHDSGHVAGTYKAACHSPTPDLPDPSCTPGAVRDDITPATIKATICTPGWTATVRAPERETSKLEPIAIKAYGLPGTPADYELDHLVPLELGGSNDVHNLWPEPGAHNPKDTTENRLKREVCAGTLSLADAQRQIATNWHNAK